MSLRALARVNLAAIERNAVRLRRELSGSGLCAVVKADGYGHGAIPVARAALAGGADRLAVVTVGEAAELRAGGIGGPVLVMGAVSAQELPVALAARADLVAWSERFVADVAAAASAPVRLHVKFVRQRVGSAGHARSEAGDGCCAPGDGGAPGYGVGGSDDAFCDC